jgi:hypothetical protein
MTFNRHREEQSDMAIQFCHAPLAMTFDRHLEERSDVAIQFRPRSTSCISCRCRTSKGHCDRGWPL